MKNLAKTLSWATVSGLLIVGTTWAGTGKLGVAVVTATTAVALKTPLYSLHEYVWGLLSRKKRKCACPCPTCD